MGRDVWIIFIAVVCFCGCPVSGFSTNYGKCERITIAMCVDMKYNTTKMPNMLGHNTQNEAFMEFQQFLPLVQVKCSPLLKFFLCSLYAPMCTEQVDEVLIIPACRSLCEDVKDKCEPILQRFEFEWPSMLDCNKLPEKDILSGNLCMDVPKVENPEIGNEGYRPEYGNPDFGDEEMKKILDILKPAKPKETTSIKTIVPSTLTPSKCPDRFVFLDNSEGNNSCGPRCNIDVFYRHKDKRVSEVWMTVWSSLCLFSTLVTVLTFLVDTSRFRYPERPIIFLSMCYAVYSLAYILRAIIGPIPISCDDTSTGELFLIQEGLESTWCIIVFLLLYFFGMASSIWWVVLTITWYLAAGRKWGREAIEALSSYFHLAAWAVPAVKTIVVLTMRRVDGEELTGLCYVGNQDRRSLLGFVLVPLVTYLAIGTMFILAGFVAMLRIRNDLKNDGANIRKLEKLMAKIGVFSVLYTVPATCVIGCLVYEYMNIEQWRTRAMNSDCKIITEGPNTGKTDCTLSQSIPTVEVYMLKIFMSLVVGITSGMWIWSSKTVNSWSTFCSKLPGGGKSRKAAASPASTANPRPSQHLGTAIHSNPHHLKQQHQLSPAYNYQKCATQPHNITATHQLPVARL